MTLPHRGMLSLLTLLVLVCVAIGGVVWLSLAHVDPATASRQQVLRHLVLTDISAEPLPVQQAWVNRLQEELATDFEPGQTANSLSSTYRARLGRNIDALQLVWFQTRTAEYAQLPAQQREAFMLQQLQVVAAWTKVAVLTDPQSDIAASSTNQLIDRIETWVMQARGQQRDDMVAAVKDATVCWLSTTDLSELPLEAKSVLAVRLANELERGARPEVSALVTDAARSKQLQRNAAQLVEAYVYERAAAFAALPQSERIPFIDNELAAVERWGIGEMLNRGEPSQSSASATLALVQHSQHWIENSPATQHQQVQAFVTAVQARVVWKQLPHWLRR